MKHTFPNFLHFSSRKLGMFEENVPIAVPVMLQPRVLFLEGACSLC